jgi:hypothetical protein
MLAEAARLGKIARTGWVARPFALFAKAGVAGQSPTSKPPVSPKNIETSRGHPSGSISYCGPYRLGGAPGGAVPLASICKSVAGGASQPQANSCFLSLVPQVRVPVLGANLGEGRDSDRFPTPFVFLPRSAAFPLQRLRQGMLAEFQRRPAQYSGRLLPWATAQIVIADSCSE